MNEIPQIPYTPNIEFSSGNSMDHFDKATKIYAKEILSTIPNLELVPVIFEKLREISTLVKNGRVESQGTLQNFAAIPMKTGMDKPKA